MNIEHAAKVLDIELAAVEKTILNLGGRTLGDRLMRRHVYDVIPGGRSTWIRLRDTGEVVTLTVKKMISERIDGTHEVEVTVDDFARPTRCSGSASPRSRTRRTDGSASSSAGHGSRSTPGRGSRRTWIEADSTEHVLTSHTCSAVPNGPPPGFR